MQRSSLTLSILATVLLVATTIPIANLVAADTDKVKAAMADLKASTEKLGAPHVEGKDLYFGKTKADNSIVAAVVKKHGGVATIFEKVDNDYVRVATTVKKEDGSSAIGTALDSNSPAVAKLNEGKTYVGDATVFGKQYVAEYDPIKDKAGKVVGADFVGQPK